MAPMTTPATVLPATRAMDSRRLEEAAESDSSLGARPKLPLQPIAVHLLARTEKGPRGRTAADGEVDQVVVGDDQQQHGVVAGGGVEAPAGGDGVRKGGDEGAHVRGRAARPTAAGRMFVGCCFILQEVSLPQMPQLWGHRGVNKIKKHKWHATS